MDKSLLLNHKVFHRSGAVGTVINVDDKQVFAEFEPGNIRRFQYPQAFTSFLTLDSKNLQEQVLEEARILNERVSQTRAKVVTHAEQKERQPYNRKSSTSSILIARPEVQKKYPEGIIGPGTIFSTHADVLNTCFGFNYKHYQKAYKDVGGGYGVWFPNIARKVSGQYVSTDDYFGWLNILTDEGRKITQIDNDNYQGGFVKEGTVTDRRKTLIFARFDNERFYSFIGVFAPAVRVKNGTERIRIGQIFDTKKKIILE